MRIRLLFTISSCFWSFSHIEMHSNGHILAADCPFFRSDCQIDANPPLNRPNASDRVHAESLLLFRP